MAEGGPDAISLRAIAREMGMTAGAIYGYYATRDELITTLIADVYTSLVDTVGAARDARPPSDAGGRLLAWGEAFRAWAIANREGFRLIYGDPVAGYQVPEAGAAPDAEHRACAGLAALVAARTPHSTRLLLFGQSMQCCRANGGHRQAVQAETTRPGRLTQVIGPRNADPAGPRWTDAS